MTKEDAEKMHKENPELTFQECYDAVYDRMLDYSNEENEQNNDTKLD